MTSKIDLQKALERAYQAGFEAGRSEQNVFLSQLQATNYELWRQLLRQDEANPVNGITISRAQALRLYQKLPSKNSGVARELKKQIKKLDLHLDRIVKILDFYKDEK